MSIQVNLKSGATTLLEQAQGIVLPPSTSVVLFTDSSGHSVAGFALDQIIGWEVK